MRKSQKPLLRSINTQLFDRISSAKARLYDRLISLDMKSLDISEYDQRYLESKLARLKCVLDLYGSLLHLSLKDSQIEPKDFVLVDYGGGSGLISLLAIEMGIGTVIYNDIYDVSCRDVEHLSRALGLTLDHIVCGDVDDLVLYLRRKLIVINAITSYDVLEHIYDVESHFKKLGCLSDARFRIVYASSANTANPRYAHSIMRQQAEVEYRTRDKKWGCKERDTLQAYLDVRKDMISTYAPDLSSELVDQLARATRGLIQRDIEKCVDEFRLHGSISYRMAHPTNTCDPYTGNWCEHLVDFEWLEQVVTNAGFPATIMTGRYDACGPLIVRGAKILLNIIIQLLGRRALFLAPYYVVYADGAKSITLLNDKLIGHFITMGAGKGYLPSAKLSEGLIDPSTMGGLSMPWG